MARAKTAAQWIKKIKDVTVNKYLTENVANTTLDSVKEKYESMLDLLENAFSWTDSPQGYDFWEKIYDHFEKGEGTKTYEDFKQYDLSVAA